MAYDPLRSKIDEKARVKWLNHKIHGVLDLSSKSPKWQKELYDGDGYGRDVYGVGPSTAKRFRKSGIVSSFQLFGKFLSFCGPPYRTWKDGADAMWKWLESCDTPSGFRSSLIDALQEKLSAGGLEHVLEPESVGKTTISEEVNAFLDSTSSRLEGKDIKDSRRQIIISSVTHSSASTSLLFCRHPGSDGQRREMFQRRRCTHGVSIIRRISDAM